MAIVVEKVGRRYYVVGDTYAFRAKLKAAGCHWDAARQAWWTGKKADAEKVVAQCNGLCASEHTICPPKQYNDFVRDKGGVWDRDRKVWILPSADAKAAIEQAIATDKARDAKRREAAAKAEADRKAAAAKPVEVLLAEAGRERRDGKDVSLCLCLGHGKRVDVLGLLPRAGEIELRTDGPYMIVSVGDVYLVTDDQIEDMDAWSQYPEGSGWYVGFRAVPVAPTAAELETAAAKAAEKAAAKRREEIVRQVQHSGTHAYDGSLADLTRLWGAGRMAGSEYLYGNAERLVYVTSSYDDGPNYWTLDDAALGAEALSLRTEGGAQ